MCFLVLCRKQRVHNLSEEENTVRNTKRIHMRNEESYSWNSRQPRGSKGTHFFPSKRESLRLPSQPYGWDGGLFFLAHFFPHAKENPSGPRPDGWDGGLFFLAHFFPSERESVRPPSRWLGRGPCLGRRTSVWCLSVEKVCKDHLKEFMKVSLQSSPWIRK